MSKIRGNVVSTNMSPDKISQRICVELDSTLSVEGMPADAKAVGDRISDIIEEIESYPNVCVERTNDGKLSTEQLGKLAVADHAILAVPNGVLAEKYYIRTDIDLHAMRVRFIRVENDLLETAEISLADLVDDVGSVTFNTYEMGGSVELDTTLSVAGKAADAKAVGDLATYLGNEIENTGGSISRLNSKVDELTEATGTKYEELETYVYNNRTIITGHGSQIAENKRNIEELETYVYNNRTIITGHGSQIEENKSNIEENTGKIKINYSNINNLMDRVGTLEDASSGFTEVFAAEYDPENEHLLSNFSEMVAAFKEGKIVTLSGTDSMGVINTLVCVHYDSAETSAYEGECLMFASCGAGYTRTVYVTSNGIADDLTTSIIQLKIDVDNIKENMGDIDAALDAIIAIQNTLIGGEGA